MKSIFIFASDLAVIVGVNRYQSLSDIILKIWQRYYKIDYQDTVNKLEKSKEIKFIPKKTSKENIEKICKKNNIDISNKIKECLAVKDTGNLLKKRTAIIKEFNQMDMKKEDKEELRKNLVSLTNTNFGISHEKNAIDVYMSQEKKNIITTNNFVKKILNQKSEEVWYIGGRIDGITDDNILIEVKNRIYKLFYTMREYERPQIQAYLQILGLEKGHLVECIKKRDGTQINIVEEKIDHEYWEEFLMPRIMIFIKLFRFFLKDINLKTVLLLGEEKEKETLLKEMMDVISTNSTEKI